MCLSFSYLIKISSITQNEKFLPKLLFRQYYISTKVDLQGSVNYKDPDPNPVFLSDPGGLKRPDLTRSRSGGSKKSEENLNKQCVQF